MLGVKGPLIAAQPRAPWTRPRGRENYLRSRKLSTAAPHQPFTFAISNTASRLFPSVVRRSRQIPSTSKERDAETGLDYFLARYYSGAQGRFTSPDEFTSGIVDPFTGQQVGQPSPLPKRGYYRSANLEQVHLRPKQPFALY